MWFSNVYLKTLRDYRIAIFGWGIGHRPAHVRGPHRHRESLVDTPQARAALVSLAASFAWMAEPVEVDTPGGYATWKYGFYDFGDGPLADPGGAAACCAATRSAARWTSLLSLPRDARAWRWKSWPPCGQRCWRWAC